MLHSVSGCPTPAAAEATSATTDGRHTASSTGGHPGDDNQSSGQLETSQTSGRDELREKDTEGQRSEVCRHQQLRKGKFSLFY